MRAMIKFGIACAIVGAAVWLWGSFAADRPRSISEKPGFKRVVLGAGLIGWGLLSVAIGGIMLLLPG